MALIRALAALLGFQLLGELISRLSGLPVPGPVTGLVLLAVYLIIAARLNGSRPVFADLAADGILGILGILFVPAGVGVIRQLGILGTYWPAIALILVVSTVLTMAVTVGTFVFVSRLMDKKA